jgi:hypothetical protein
MTISFVDACRFVASASGTGAFTVGSPVTGYQLPSSAAAIDGATYRYRAESNDLSQWEVGFGVWTSATSTLLRSNILFSSNSNLVVSFTAAPQVAIVYLAEDAVSSKNNLSDLSSAATARTNLGLGNSAILNVGTTAGTVAAGDDSRIVGAAQKSANLSDLTSIPTALVNLGLSGSRTILSGDLNLYVNGSTGNDGNNGLAPTSAFATIARAVFVAIANYDTAGHNIIINVADATYTVASSGLIISSPLFGGGGLTLIGNTTTPANVVVTPGVGICAFKASGGGTSFSLKGFKFSGTSNYGLISTNDSQIFVTGNVDFGSGSLANIRSDNGGKVDLSGTAAYAISGGGGRHYWAFNNSLIVGAIPTTPQTVTITGSPSFIHGFAQAQALSTISAQGQTFSGAVSPPTPNYDVSGNSVIDTAGGGGTYFPGTTAGSSSTGGQYF